jgi:hypothetical protein
MLVAPADEMQLKKAIHQAALTSDIAHLEEGLATVIGSRGVAASLWDYERLVRKIYDAALLNTNIRRTAKMPSLQRFVVYSSIVDDRLFVVRIAIRSEKSSIVTGMMLILQVISPCANVPKAESCLYEWHI